MTDDYTQEIKERLAAYHNSDHRLWYEEPTHEESIFLEYAPIDIANLLAERKVLRESLQDLFKMLDENILVRNIDQDDEPDFAERMCDLVMRLKKCQEFIAWEPKK